MWETALSFCIKYWATFLLGSIAAGISLFVKNYFSLVKQDIQFKQNKRYKEILDSSKENSQAMYDKILETIEKNVDASKAGDKKLHERLDESEKINKILKDGLLALHRKAFIHECQRLLEPNHIITLDEWDELTEDHNVYNSLGGNSKGDEYYNLVRKKFTTNTILHK